MKDASRPATLVTWTTLLLLGCGGDPVGEDASVPDAAVPDAGLVTPPQIPWLDDGVPPIGLTPCPPGWREVPPESAGGVATCDPYPEGGAVDCAPDEAHFPGEPGCTRVGTACPADGWPVDIPEGRPLVYVRAGAPTGGDGTSRGSAFSNIGDALSTATVGTIVAVAVGDYDEALSPGVGVTLWGACASGTRLTSSLPSTGLGVITVRREDTEVRNLTIQDAARPAVWVLGTWASLRLLDVIVSSTHSFAVAGQSGATIEMSGCVLQDTRSDADGTLGVGLYISDGAEAEVTRALFERNRSWGIYVAGNGSLRLADVVVRDTLAQESDGAHGRGLEVQTGMDVEVVRTLFERNNEAALAAYHEGTRLRLTDVVVRDTLAHESDVGSGMGLVAESHADVEVTRALFERNHDYGLTASDSGTLLRLTDVVVRDTLQQGTADWSGFGLAVVRGARAGVIRAALERNHSAGVIVSDGGIVQLTDVVLRDTLGAEITGMFGRGIEVSRGGRAEVMRTLLERNTEIGVFTWGEGTALRLADVVVRDTLGRQNDGAMGAGLWVQSGAHVGGRGIILHGNRFVGAGVVHGASLQLNDTEIRDTRRADCAETTCPEAAGGFGISAHFFGATAQMTRFTVSNSALCAVAVGQDPDVPEERGGEMDLADGIISGAPVGACVQVDGYDSSRLRRNVQYVDVGVPLQATSYELPGAIDEP